ncbi:MAG TPA: DUF2066 domain-containing protein [Cycloclasticus sp.]|jgi:hypothetical protein|nr:DUF2066 domain-containing protein [Cycloclasticus sp.]
MRYLLGFMLLVLFAPMPLYAVQVDGLYSTTVAVDDQSQAARNVAIRIAITKVVQKVSGRRSVVKNAPLQAALSNVGSYVEQFQYKPTEDDEPGYWLTVRFQKMALDRVLQQFDVPVWGANRPDVLVWLAVDDGVKKYVVGPESEELAALLKQAATETGLAITLPLFDLEDQSAVSFNDVWAGFSDHILSASERYNAKQVMFGRLLREGKTGWRLNWTLMSANDQYARFEYAERVESVLPAMLADTAEHLANVYAPRGITMLNTLSIHISGVQNLTRFVEVTEYLQSLDIVKTVDWNQVVNNNVTLKVSITGDMSVLKGIIAFNNVLQPTLDPHHSINTSSNSSQSIPNQSFEQRLYYKAD